MTVTAPAPQTAALSPRRGPIVLPTRFGGAFAGFALLTLIGCINYQLSLGYAITFLMFSVWVVSAVHASRALNGVALSARAPESAFAGGQATFTVTLMNPSGLPRAAVSVRPERRGAQARVTLDVPARGQASGPLALPAARRGHLRLPLLLLEANDPLGLWRASREARLDLQTLVYPEPEAGAPALPTAGLAAEGHGAARASGDEDFQGLREYRPGDSMRRVAWRQAARTGELFTRLLDAPAAHTLQLDWSATRALHDPEARLSRLTAWVLTAARAGGRYSLHLPGLQVPPGSGDAQARRALTALALYEWAPQERA